MTSNLTISAEESARFAALSGDCNPIHTDETTARRLMYGRTVVHGIHTLCCTLDRWAQSQLRACAISSLTADFKSPVHAGDTLQYESLLKKGQNILLAKKDGLTVLKARLGIDNIAIPISAANKRPPTEIPLILSDAELATATGRVELAVASTDAINLFPDLVRVFGTETLALLCATTRVVGMKCPGMHSLYTRLQLEWTPSDEEATHLGYSVDNYDDRFGMVDLQFEAPGIKGSALCYRRPAPVEQAGVAELMPRVKTNQFAGQRALVIGGSRGLGRYTAAILAAGGAYVTLTYRSGKDEAEEMIADIQTNGAEAAALQLDASNPAWLDSLGDLDFTHIYYFASPKIAANSGEFDDALYAGFRSIFVDAPLALLERAVTEKKSIQFFVPSTIYVSEPEPGFAEYIRAKTEMELSCGEVAAASSCVEISMPRLPRLKTDQTIGIGDEDFADTGDVLIPLLTTIA